MRYSSMIYTSYKYIRVLFLAMLKRGCSDSSIQGTGYGVFCRPAYRQLS